MQNSWTDRWNERYSQADYAYGTQPNQFLQQQLEKLTPGSILFPAEGEGRNAVFAAQLGWRVSAFDISTEGKTKALQLAQSNQVTIDYQVGELQNLDYASGQFDVITLIYAHFPAAIKSAYHQTLNGFLRKGGVVIFEAFSKKHLDCIAQNPKVGGPKELDMLFSIEEIQTDFANYEFLELQEIEIELNEGIYHNGTGSVIRFIGRKK